MDLVAVVRLVRRRWWLPVVMGLGVAAVALALSSISEERYRSTATMRLRTPGAVSTDNVRPDSVDYLDRLQTTYADLVTSDAFEREVIARSDATEPLTVFADLRAGSEVFTIGVETAERPRVRAAADAAAALLVEQVRNQDLEMLASAGEAVRAQVAAAVASIETLRAELAVLEADPDADPARITQLRAEIRIRLEEATRQEAALASWRMGLIDRSNLLSVLAPASAPVTAGGPPALAIGLIGMFVGTSLGVGASVILEARRQTVDDPADVAMAGGAPVLGVVDTGERSEARADALSPVALALVAATPEPTLLIAPASGSVGWPPVTAGLASAFAQLDRRVVVVGAGGGLMAALGVAGGTHVYRTSGVGRRRPGETGLDGVSFLQLGPGAAGEGRISPPRLQKLVTELREDFDVVVVHGDAFGTGPDILVQASAVPDVVVTVELAHQTRGELELTVQQLEAVGARVRGFVVVRERSRGGRRVG